MMQHKNIHIIFLLFLGPKRNLSNTLLGFFKPLVYNTNDNIIKAIAVLGLQ